MSKKVVVISKCDYPECDSSEPEATLNEVDLWFYKPGKGRKPAPVRVDLCEPHFNETASLMNHFMRNGDSDNASMPENRSNK